MNQSAVDRDFFRSIYYVEPEKKSRVQQLEEFEKARLALRVRLLPPPLRVVEDSNPEGLFEHSNTNFELNIGIWKAVRHTDIG